MRPLTTIYAGVRRENGVCLVTRDGQPLALLESIKVHSHSPSDFNWGYGGSGPAQLALAILLDFAGRRVAERLYQDFKWQVVARLEGDAWQLTGTEICRWTADELRGRAGDVGHDEFHELVQALQAQPGDLAEDHP